MARLEVRHLSKTFGSIRVLSAVHLSVRPGEIHALVGQNGSGKSTIIKVIAGYHTPDRGAEMRVDGEVVHLPVKPGSLSRVGISIVHQDLGLVEHLSAAENISVGQERCSPLARRLDRRREAQEARQILERLHVPIDPARLVRDLDPEARASVAIARAMRSQIDGKGLIILDESTRALSKEAAEPFYQTLRRAVAGGGSVLIVAHSLPEVMAVADRVTVIRDGEIVADGRPASDLSEQSIARLMLGRELEHVRRWEHHTVDAPAVEVRDLSTNRAGTLSFSIGEREIVGLTGSAGSGWEEVPRLLAGAAHAEAGVLSAGVREFDLSRSSVRDLLRAGVVLVPERRELEGIAPGLSVSENISLPRIGRRGRAWFSGVCWQRDEAERVIEEFGIQPPDPRTPVGKLSGGNRQKVLFGKWLLDGPKLLILHEPTQGVDVSARQDLLQAVVKAARSGTSILLVTNDVSDLSAVCRRVLVMHAGSVTHELLAPEPDEIVASVYEGTLTAGVSNE